MDVTGQDSDWRSAAFRQKLVSQIDEVMRKAGVAHNKSSKDMENHVFMKAKNREEYLSLVARLIIHFRDIHNKKSQASVSDPMNALQTLTGGPPAGTPGMGMTSQTSGASISGLSGLGQLGQPQPGASGMAQHGMARVPSASQQIQLQQMAQQQQHQFQQQQAALQHQQQQQQQQQQQAALQQQQQFQVQQQQFQVQQQVAAAQQQQQQQQQQQLQAVQQQQQQQHMLKLQMQQQNQQQMQQQQHQLHRIAQIQQLHQAAHAMQTQQPIPQQPPPQQVIQQQMQQMQQQQQQQQVTQAQQPQLPQQSQPQVMVSQGQVMPVTLSQQQQLKMQQVLQARAQIVQQHQPQPQHQQQVAAAAAAAAVQAVQAVQAQAQAQASQMAAAGGQMITATMARGGMQIRPRFPPATAVSATPPSSTPLGGQQMPQSQVSQSNITMMSSPSPVQQVQTPQSMPPPPQPQPSPQPGQPTSQPNSNVSSGPAPSPSSFLPSPSPQPSQSPAAARTPQNFSVPSPGPLNTPGNPNSVMSPANSCQSEDQQYLDKLRQLSKYIEPLRRMIHKIDKNEDRKKDLSKMKSLLDILTDPSKRCPLKTLEKCEIALDKLKNESDSVLFTPPPPTVPPTKQQYLCQPLLDAVLPNIRSPVFNHSLYRTFMPAMMAIHGPPITAQIITPQKRKFEDDERQTIPNVLQGEVARLNPKFMVNLDPSHCSNNGTVHLICKLDDKDLPSVPPLQLSVPADYPDQSPLWVDNPRQYEANPFLQSVYRYMTSKLLQLPDKHSITALLNTWALSIRQACLSAA
ncbi:mediator of RNA polymerase II transcription subunit 15 isoform X2 [Rhinatrema bivittatum]|uniref:mediator of RNA polymerase II transcription subunit 15 isoform X2 n=1 Tax=Rhinatrema bivittatum TaxID=194408 RepID=UPI001128B38B|nr:mediator of RNA polymerase II transcription subunit 15 isoform X2 [Rhinatrema bivittatum]